MSKQPVAMAPPSNKQSAYEELIAAQQRAQQMGNMQNAAQNMLSGMVQQGNIGIGQQQGAGISGGMAPPSPTLADTVDATMRNMKRRHAEHGARCAVLEFFQAQVNINPFASDKIAAEIYEAAIRAALKEINK